jgi:hypothetical protein
MDRDEIAGLGLEVTVDPELAAKHDPVDHEVVVEKVFQRLLRGGDCLVLQPIPHPVLVGCRALVVEHLQPVRH